MTVRDTIKVTLIQSKATPSKRHNQSDNDSVQSYTNSETIKVTLIQSNATANERHNQSDSDTEQGYNRRER